MKKVVIVVALLATCLSSVPAWAGIFGHRSRPATSGYRSYSPQPTSGYRSYSQQPAPRASDFPFSSRSDPRDWHEAHRGYGVKIRGW